MSIPVENEEIVQAILIVDPFHGNFRPFCSTTSLALLPLVNVPLIEYTLETLNRNGVQELIVFCSNHMRQVRSFIEERQQQECTWASKMAITIIGSGLCRGLGDALRDLESRHIIRGHVILLGVDSLTNANLGALLAQHKRTAKLDRGAVMTVVYKESMHRLRTGNEVMVMMDSCTHRLLFHLRLVSPQEHRERHFKIPLNLFLANRNVTVCHGLHDPQIAICSHAVLPLFADNFDFLTRDHFLSGVLNCEEILNSRIYVALLGRKQYALRINNWQTYHMASLDVMNRWVHPLVPDMAISQFRVHYNRKRNNIYYHRNVRLCRSCDFGGDLVVDGGSTIKEDTSIRQSVVGRACKIGRNCRIRNSFLFEGVIISDGCVLEHCVIGSAAQVGTGCHILNGTVLGDGVVVPSNMTVEKVMVQATKPTMNWDGSSRQLGERAYTVPKEQEPDGIEDIDSVTEEGATFFDPPLTLAPLRSTYSLSLYLSSDDETNDETTHMISDDSAIFLSEVFESLKCGLADQTNAEYLILEINSSRYAYNVSLGEVNFCVVKAILQILVLQQGVAMNTVGTLHKLLACFGFVYKHYIRNDGAMLDCLKAFEEMSQSNDLIRAKIVQLLHYLHKSDLMSGQVLLCWYRGIKDETLKKKLYEFMEWLIESSDDEEDEDES